MAAPTGPGTDLRHHAPDWIRTARAADRWTRQRKPYQGRGRYFGCGGNCGLGTPILGLAAGTLRGTNHWSGNAKQRVGTPRPPVRRRWPCLPCWRGALRQVHSLKLVTAKRSYRYGLCGLQYLPLRAGALWWPVDSAAALVGARFRRSPGNCGRRLTLGFTFVREARLPGRPEEGPAVPLIPVARRHGQGWSGRCAVGATKCGLPPATGDCQATRRLRITRTAAPLIRLPGCWP